MVEQGSDFTKVTQAEQAWAAGKAIKAGFLSFGPHLKCLGLRPAKEGGGFEPWLGLCQQPGVQVGPGICAPGSLSSGPGNRSSLQRWG